MSDSMELLDDSRDVILQRDVIVQEQRPLPSLKATPTHEQITARLAYVSLGGMFCLVALVIAMIWSKGVPDGAALALLGSLITGVFGLAQQSLSVFTGGPAPKHSSQDK